MSINLNDFLGLHLVWLWLLMAALFAALELLRRDWSIAVLAVAALAAALTAVIVGHAWYVQLAVFVVAAIIGEMIVHRPRILEGDNT